VTSNKLAYVGLAFKAGNALCGTAACEKGIKHGKVKLLILQDRISAGSEKHFRLLCERNNVALIMEKAPLGEAIGRPGIMVIGITDVGLKNAIINKEDSIKGSGK
jgi:ribosomal protein L7Ae-like RNA K-turn-binding protein